MDTTSHYECAAGETPGRRLYLLNDGGVVYFEDSRRFAGLDAAGVAAYRALSAGATVAELRTQASGIADSAASLRALDAIGALIHSTPPVPLASAQWPELKPSSAEDAPAANIEIAGIPVLLETPQGPLASLSRDFFRKCPPSHRHARCILSARPTAKGWAIFVNERKFFCLHREEQIGLGLMHAARSLLYAKSTYDVAFHAAMVARHDCGVLLCAPRESGKSTLAAYLVSRGFNLLADEPALLDLETSCVIDLGLPLSLKEGSWAVLEDAFPSLASAPTHIRSDGARIRLIHSVQLERPGPRRLTQIVFPRFAPSAPAELERVSPLQALRLLNEGGMQLSSFFTKSDFEALLNLICWIPAYAFRYPSLLHATGMLREIGIASGS